MWPDQETSTVVIMDVRVRLGVPNKDEYRQGVTGYEDKECRWTCRDIREITIGDAHYRPPSHQLRAEQQARGCMLRRHWSLGSHGLDVITETEY